MVTFTAATEITQNQLLLRMMLRTGATIRIQVLV